MAEDFAQEKTEAPTQHRRDEARKKGQTPSSSDISQAFLLLTALGVLWFYAPSLANSMGRILQHDLLLAAHTDWTVDHTIHLFTTLVRTILAILMPILLTMAVAGLSVNLIQTGFNISYEPLTPDLARLSLTKGVRRLFSLRSLIRGVMLLLKLSLGLAAAAWFASNHQDQLVGLHVSSLLVHLSDTWRFCMTLGFVLAGTLFVIGAIDYFFQRWQHEQDLRMSKQEIKDENKMLEGDPQVKNRMRRAARDSLRLQMLRAVPEATVVLTNPTHIAVALKYDRGSMEAPRVIAKGTDAFAKRIAQVARENDIPVLERKPLARALYASVEVNQEIPANLYRAIAEILAYVYNLKRSA